MRFARLASIALAAAAPAAAERLPYAPLDEAEPELAGAPRLAYALLDRLEWAPQRGQDGYAWDFSLLYTGDTHGLWLSSVGDGGLWGAPDYLEFQALYARKLPRDLSLNAGLRWDARPAPQRFYAVAGGQWEPELGRHDLWIGAFGYLSHKGEFSARLGGISNHALTGKLYAQPSFEVNASAEDVPELGLGRGLSYAEAGLRLRYELSRRFAPYLGLSWERSLGRTAGFARAAGDDVEAKSLVVGVRSYWAED
jgi:copper resistance protein B